MIDLGITITGDDPEAFLRELSKGMEPATARAVLRASQIAAGELSAAVMDTLTKRPTGALARSFEVEFEQSGGTVSAGAFSRLPYARVQDEGGEILPVRSKHLAIPLPGVGRGQRPREFPRPLIPIKSRKGNLLLAEVVGKGKRAKMKPRYLLRRSVVLPGAGYILRAHEALLGQLDGIAERELLDIERKAKAAAR